MINGYAINDAAINDLGSRDSEPVIHFAGLVSRTTSYFGIRTSISARVADRFSISDKTNILSRVKVMFAILPDPVPVVVTPWIPGQSPYLPGVQITPWSGTLIQSQIQVTLSHSSTGRVLAIKSYSISQSSGSFGWAGNIDLKKKDDFHSVSKDDAVVLTIGNESYKLLVDVKNLSRSKVQEPTYSLAVISPTAKLASPRATLKTKTWDSSELAKDICTEVASGYPMQWEIENWMIAGGLVSATDEAPKDIISKVASAVKGVLSTTPEGTLRVRKKFKTPLSQLGSGDHYYTDLEHNTEVSESIAVKANYNKFVITSETSSTGSSESIKIEVDSRTDGKNNGATNFTGGSTVYLYVTKPSNVTITKVVSSAGSIASAGNGTIKKKETLTFDDVNTASLSDPMYSGFTYTWVGTSLGAVSVGANRLDIKSDSKGVAVLDVEYDVLVDFYALTIPTTINAKSEFEINVMVEGAVATSTTQSTTKILAVRGNGDKPGPEVSEPMLCTLNSLIARGVAELDEASDYKAVTLTTIYRPNVHDGDTVTVYESLYGETWNGVIDAITHSGELGKTQTKLEVLRV